MTDATTSCKCGKAAKGKRLPPGWHRLKDDTPVCAECWDKAYVLRSITMPVVAPVDCNWDEVWGVMKTCWRASTAVANWAVTELVKVDPVRMPTDVKMGKCPTPYLYPGARAVAPDMDSTSVTSLLRAVERKYRARRYEVVWLRSAALPSYRYPMPYPVHNQSWSVELVDGSPIVSVRLGGARRQFRLVAGSEWRRQLGQVKQIVDGLAFQGELAILQKVVHNKPRLFVKMVAWLPRKEATAKSGVLCVNTVPDRLWVVTGGAQPWMLNCDQIRERIIAHERFLQRSREDLKHEKRWPAWKRRQLLEDQRKRCDKHAQRMNSFLHDASAMLANYAERQKLARVIYDDTDQSWCQFPWFRLRELLAQKLDERGIEFSMVAASQPAPQGTP